MKLEPGLRHSVSETVSEAKTAKAVGSGSVDVYATPMMIALMERAAAECIQGALEPGQTSVGASLKVEHTAATPVGMAVSAEAVVTGVEGRKISFTLTARDAAGEIGGGTHSRVLVDRERFEDKARAKGAQ